VGDVARGGFAAVATAPARVGAAAPLEIGFCSGSTAASLSVGSSAERMLASRRRFSEIRYA
jgi:hypothetical protein